MKYLASCIKVVWDTLRYVIKAIRHMQVMSSYDSNDYIFYPVYGKGFSINGHILI